MSQMCATLNCNMTPSSSSAPALPSSSDAARLEWLGLKGLGEKISFLAALLGSAGGGAVFGLMHSTRALRYVLMSLVSLLTSLI